MHPRARAIAAVFAANGLGAPSFLARLPERQADLGISDAGLGLVLVGASVGALVASPVAGRLVGSVGSRTVVLASTAILGGCLPLVGAAPGAGALFLALALVGAADAAMDIAMNANGAAFEGRADRSVMHGLHAAWSFGALAAAGIAALGAAAGVPVTVHLAGAGLLLVAATLAARRGLVPDDRGRAPIVAAVGTTAATGHGDAVAGPADRGADGAREAGERRTTWRRRRPGRAPFRRAGPTAATTSTPAGDEPATRRLLPVWPLAMLAAATVGGAVIEGAPTDWGAVQLERYGSGKAVAALGIAAFMAGMVAGRLVGDGLTDRLGGPRVLRAGASLVAGGLAVGALAGHPAVFLAGLALAGLGAAGFFPIAFSAAARTPGVSPGAGAATVSLAARLGFIVEPVLVGAVAEAVGLRWAFGLVAATAVLLAAAAGRVVPSPTAAAAAAAARA